MTIEVWKFATVPELPRQASVVLAAFGRGPLAEGVPLSRAEYGVPEGVALDTIEVRTIARAQDPAWFEGWRTGSLRAIAAQDLDAAALAELDAADHVHVIATEVTAPRDLGYLQAAWALARYVVARGASVVADAHAMAFLAGRALSPAGAPLDTTREVRRVFETSSTRPDLAHAIHTRGLKKFGGPDLVALCTDADARFVGHAMGKLADAIARGTDIVGARHQVDVAPGVTWFLVEDEHRLGELLQLNNRARVLVDEAGKDLLGVLERLPRGAG